MNSTAQQRKMAERSWREEEEERWYNYLMTRKGKMMNWTWVASLCPSPD
jgi:hypothetical protein